MSSNKNQKLSSLDKGEYPEGGRELITTQKLSPLNKGEYPEGGRELITTQKLSPLDKGEYPKGGRELITTQKLSSLDKGEYPKGGRELITTQKLSSLDKGEYPEGGRELITTQKLSPLDKGEYPEGGRELITTQKLSSLDKGEYPEGGRELIKKHPPTNHIINQPNLQKFRRTLRKEGTPAEGALWKILKNKQVEGLRFHRQYSIDNYILDFYCPKIKLAIELDGDYHYHTFVPDHDYERDKELLEKYGIKTIRFENKDVWEQPQSIVDCIVKEATK